MNASMDAKLHHRAVQRALALGRATDPGALPELARLLAMPSAEIRRLAASAVGKLAAFGADANVAVQALAPVALRDPHPQAQQYALKALKAYGAMAREHLHDLDDLAANEQAKDYVRRAAHSAAEAIRDAIRHEQEAARHKCARCGRDATAEEHTRSQQTFQRTFCDSCFDEQEGKRLISLHPADKPRLDAILRTKLGLFGYHIPQPGASGVGEQ